LKQLIFTLKAAKNLEENPINHFPVNLWFALILPYMARLLQLPLMRVKASTNG